MVELEDGSNTIDIDLVPVFAFPPKKLEFYERIWSNIDTSEGGPHWLKGSTGFRDFKWRAQNWKDFCLKINTPKGNDWILRIGVMGSCQKVPWFDFQNQFSVSKIIGIPQYFFIEEYQFSSKIAYFLLLNDRAKRNRFHIWKLWLHPLIVALIFFCLTFES